MIYIEMDYYDKWVSYKCIELNITSEKIYICRIVVWRCKLLFLKFTNIQKFQSRQEKVNCTFYMKCPSYNSLPSGINSFLLLLCIKKVGVLKGILPLWWSKSVVQIHFQKEKRLKSYILYIKVANMNIFIQLPSFTKVYHINMGE